MMTILTRLIAIAQRIFQPIKKIFYRAVRSPFAPVYGVIVLYLIGGAIVAYQVYRRHDTSPTVERLLSVYPLPAATVNGEIIPVLGVYKQLQFVKKYEITSGQQVGSEIDVEKQLIDRMADDALLAQESRKVSVSVSDKEINDAFDAIVKQQGGQQAVLTYLKEFHGISEQDFKDLIHSQLIRQKVRDDGIVHIQIRHILLLTQDDANAVLDQLNKNQKTFEQAAHDSSRDKDTADTGGKITQKNTVNGIEQQTDWIAKGALPKGLDEVVFSDQITVGKVYTKPVHSESGWHVVRIDSKKGMLNQTFGDLLKDLRSKAKIKKYL